MGEEVKPQGVEKGGSRANGVNGGEGREERPVPPIMAIGIGSARGEILVSGIRIKSGGNWADRSRWRVVPPLSKNRIAR